MIARTISGTGTNRNVKFDGISPAGLLGCFKLFQAAFLQLLPLPCVWLGN